MQAEWNETTRGMKYISASSGEPKPTSHPIKPPPSSVGILIIKPQTHKCLQEKICGKRCHICCRRHDWILCEYRGRGYGTKAIEHFLHEFSGDFFHYVLRENLPARQLWSAVAVRFDLREVMRSDISCGDISELELHCFERSAN